MNTPLVTVLMPVYNGEKYLKEAIDSILAQTYRDFDFMIINDGSTDQSEAIILSYKDKRIRYVKNEQNLKLIATLNKGIDLIHTKYIARMDADDISLPERLEKQVTFMEGHDEVGLLGTWFESFNERGSLGIAAYQTSHDAICFKQFYQIQISHGAAMIRTVVLMTMTPYFDPQYAHAEDYELFTRMSLNTKLANIPTVLLKVRKHADEVSSRFSSEQQHNSQLVRKRLFKYSGIEITEDLLNDYIQLNYQNYMQLKTSPEVICRLFEDMMKSLAEKSFINADFLEQELRKIWFNYCYAKGYYKLYLRNENLKDNRYLTIKQQIKFLVKAVLKH